MDPTLKEKVLAKDKWLKALFIVLFGLLSYVVLIVIWIVAAIQFLYLLFTGSSNQRLAEFGDALGTYVSQVILYLTFRSDGRPFPFGDWPHKKKEHKEE